MTLRQLADRCRTIARRFILAEPEVSYWKTVLRVRFVVAMLVMMVIGHYVSEFWLFKIAAQAGQGAMVAGLSSKPARYVQVVEIDSSDYEKLFDAQSPLKADRLGKLLEALVAAKPAAVVVDIDTSSSSFQKMALPASDIPIVWAREKSTYRNEPSVIAGGRAIDPKYWGYVDYQPGIDGYLTDFPRTVNDGMHPQSTLHWAAVEAYCDRQAQHAECALGQDHESLQVTERTNLQTLYAHDFIQIGKDAQVSRNRGIAGELLSGKIVFLGGSYSSCDHYSTYIAPKPILGVRLLALASEAELEHNWLGELSELTTTVFDIAISLLLAAIYYYFRPMPAMLTSLFLVTLAIMYASYLAFLAEISVDYIPFILGIWLELMVRGGEESE